MSANTEIIHTDDTSDTESKTLTVGEYSTLAGLDDSSTALTIDAIRENFETNVDNFVTDTTVNSADVTSVVNSCEIL